VGTHNLFHPLDSPPIRVWRVGRDILVKLNVSTNSQLRVDIGVLGRMREEVPDGPEGAHNPKVLGFHCLQPRLGGMGDSNWDADVGTNRLRPIRFTRELTESGE
jgi:hypothetical protein